MEAIIKYRGSKACFNITDETVGIFTARLLYLEGTHTALPDQKITLVKGARYWTGSVDDEILLNELGRFIEENWTAS